MRGLDAGRIDENLVERPRQRHGVDLAARKLDGDDVLGLAVAVELIKVGADRRLHRIDEMAQDAVLVEAFDRLQCGFDGGRDLGLARRALVVRRRQMRIEPGVEQGDDLRGDGRMLAQRRPHVTLRIGHADLAQEARDGADQRDVAPAESGHEHQRVIAVALGPFAHDDEKTGFETLLERSEVDRLARRTLQLHVVEPDLRRALRLDVIGALIDDAKAHVFQHRHPLGQ